MADRKREDPPPEREAGALPLKLWRALDRAHAALAAAAGEQAARHGLSIAELEVLDTLRRKGPLSVGQVQRRVRVSSGGATYLVSRLEARGLLERRAVAGDRRARLAALTPAGEAFVAAAQPGLGDRLRRALSGMGKKDRRALLELLQALEDSCVADEHRDAEQRAERTAAERSRH
ncbi:MAG: MarR family transcriptional regulator [Gemmatimonadetes bacterium]|nr:MarR family transcriptional regulator [Gemmatimonadota bacterium]